MHLALRPARAPPEDDAITSTKGYILLASDRDRVRGNLADVGISTAVFYPIPLHLQECFADLRYREGDFPESEKAAKEVLALPMFPQLTDDEVERVAREVIAAIG